MKLSNIALCIRGISYSKTYKNWENKGDGIQHDKCLFSLNKYIINPIGINNINIFLSTYNNSKLYNIINDYKPVDIILYDFNKSKKIKEQSSIYGIIATQMKDCLDMIINYSKKKNKEFKFIILNRFDIFLELI